MIVSSAQTSCEDPDHLFCVGVNHKTTSIEMREKFFLSVVEKELLLSELKNNPEILGAFVLSTCNRTEIYAHLLMDRPQIIFEVLFRIKKLKITPELSHNFYFHKAADTVRHLFRVISGLDSLVLGEKQILGQVKEAADIARQCQMMTRELNILSNLAIRAGKKAQTETEVGFGGSSISWAAVATMQEKLGTLSGKTILVIGAGKMGALAAEQLRNKNVGTVYVMNRSCDKAASVADEIAGIAVGFWQMKEILQKVDACICSAGAPHYLIETDLVQEVMAERSGKSLVLIDISMPRNIQPEVAAVGGVELLTIDQLDQVVEGSVCRRRNAVSLVERIIEQKEKEYFLRVQKAKIAQVQAAVTLS